MNVTMQSTTSSIAASVPDACEPEIIGTLNMDCACCICFQPPPLDGAVVIHPCEHVFCEACLTMALQKRPECPLDRAHVDGVHVRVERAGTETLALIRSVVVQCSARRDGCSWEGTWGEWSDTQHATRCTFRKAVCHIAGCVGGDSIEAPPEQPTPHDQSHLYHHVQLLARHLKSVEEQNRALRWEVDALKERLYATQNDLVDWQHTTRREKESDASATEHLARDTTVLATNIEGLFPVFHIPAIHGSGAAAPSSPKVNAPLWDENCCSRNAALDGAILRHSGRGWATAFGHNAVTIHRNQGAQCPSYIRFRILAADDGAEHASLPLPMAMIGVGVRRHPSNIPSTQHAGSLPGCWALQGSGFVWDGTAALCGQLGDDAATTFGVGDTIVLYLEPKDDVCHLRCSKGDGTALGLGGTLRFANDIIRLFPVASIGSSSCAVELLPSA